RVLLCAFEPEVAVFQVNRFETQVSLQQVFEGWRQADRFDAGQGRASAVMAAACDDALDAHAGPAIGRNRSDFQGDVVLSGDSLEVRCDEMAKDGLRAYRVGKDEK